MESSGAPKIWRFWPVIVLAFVYPINVGVIGLAIPLYYLKIGISVEVIGFLSAGTAMAYWFSPIVLTKISKRLGRKKSVILASIGTLVAQSFFYLSLHPLVMLLARLSEGFITGLYWTNLQSTISDNHSLDHPWYFSRYNVAWNSGVLIGQLMGMLLLFFMDDLLIVFYSAPLLIIILVIMSIGFFNDSIGRQVKQKSRKVKNNGAKTGHSIEDLKEQKLAGLELEPCRVPLIVPVLLMVAFVFGRVSGTFLYPVKSELLGFEPYTVYLLAFLSIGMQILSTSLGSLISIRKMRSFTALFLSCAALSVLGMALNVQFLAFLLLFLSIGFFGGFMYAQGLNLLMKLNVVKKTSIYSNIGESVIGLCFFILPVLLGYVIASTGVNFGFYVNFISMAIIFVLLMIIMEKLKSS